MRITTRQLKRIIAEEVTRVLAEAAGDDVELVGTFTEAGAYYKFKVKYKGTLVDVTCYKGDAGDPEGAAACINQSLYQLDLIGEDDYPSGVEEVAQKLVAYASQDDDEDYAPAAPRYTGGRLSADQYMSLSGVKGKPMGGSAYSHLRRG